MLSGIGTHISAADYRAAAEEALRRTSEGFQVTPDKKLADAALQAAIGSLEASGSVDEAAIEAAREAAKSVFIGAGFSPRAYQAKYGQSAGFAGINWFKDRAPTTAKPKGIPGDSVYAQRKASSLLGEVTDVKAKELAGLIDAIA